MRLNNKHNYNKIQIMKEYKKYYKNYLHSNNINIYNTIIKYKTVMMCINK